MGSFIKKIPTLATLSIVLFVLAGIFLRLWLLGTVPGGLFADELAIAIDAKTILQSGTDQYGKVFPLTFEALTDFRLPLYVYLVVPFIKLFGPDNLAVRLPSALASIVSIFLTGAIALEVFKTKKVALFSMLALALSPFAIHFARIAYETSVASALLLVFVLSLLKLVNGTSRRGLWLSLACAASLFGNWVYSASLFSVPIITFLVMCYVFIFKRDKRLLLNLSIILGFWFLTFVPSLFLSGRLNGRPGSYVETGLKNFYILPSFLRIWTIEFLFLKGDIFSNRHGTLENGVFLIAFLPAFFAGVITFIKNLTLKNSSLVVFGLALLVCALPSSLTSITPYGPRFLPEVAFLALLTGLGLNALATKFPSKLLALLFFGILLFNLLHYCHIYFVHFNGTSGPSFPEAPKMLSEKVKTYLDHGENVYLFDEKSCRKWGHDEMYLWYYLDLDNKRFIPWNANFRTLRYTFSGGAFNAYEEIPYPKLVYAPNLVFFPGTEETRVIPNGAVVVRCGPLRELIGARHGEILDTIYMYPKAKEDPYYFIYRQSK